MHLPSPRGSETADRWFPFRSTRAEARLRLFCLPYAGGSAGVFRGWERELPAAVELWPVQPPGRERRLREPPFVRLDALVSALVEVLTPHLDRPFALLGHSLGGLVAFELTRRLRALRAPLPVHLLVSGSRAPHFPLPWSTPYHTLGDAELAERLRNLGGTPPEILEHEELMQLILPIVRADFEVLETYRFEPGEPLEVPLSAFGGRQDDGVPATTVEGWRAYTRGRWRWQLFDGGHFFLHERRGELLREVSRDLAAYL